MEHGTFTPLVLSTAGGMAREANAFYKRLAQQLATKENENYSVVMHGYNATCSSVSFEPPSCAFAAQNDKKKINKNIDTEQVAKATAANRLPC